MNWFFTPEPRDGAGVRLFCLPYAGASAAVFRDWGRSLPAEVEVRAVQLAGRGWRLREPPEVDLGTQAEGVADAIAACADRPFAIFGHSMGSWLGLEVVRLLERRGLSPVVLFASGRQAPSVGATRPPLSHLDDERFVEQVQKQYGGIPAPILDDREILELLLPALRADITSLETYRHEPAPKITCPLIAVGGDRDPIVPIEHLEPWQAVTGGEFLVRTFPGGHFYFQPDAGELLGYLHERIELAAGMRGAGK
jgi:medium-chain acyl-[acyl-carrier-protein] hydrolase